MKKVALLIASAIIGIMIIYVVNGSEIASFGYGIELPIGWQEPSPLEDPICTLQARYDEGLPLSTQRPVYSCQTATNSLANFLNLALGAMVGIVVAFGVNKITRKK